MSKGLILILLYFLILPIAVISQTKYINSRISLKVKIVVNRLQKYDEVVGSAIGKAAAKPYEYEVFEKLENKAREGELYELTNHPNPIIRAYAFEGLIIKNSLLILEVISKNQSDTATIIYRYGCTGGRETTVIGFMISKIETFVEENNVELTDSQKILIDRIIQNEINWQNRLELNKQYLNKYIDTFPIEANFFEDSIVSDELKRILKRDFNNYLEHISQSNCSKIVSEGKYFYGYASQPNKDGHCSIFIVNPNKKKMHIFWLTKTIADKRYKIYGDQPIPTDILFIITKNMHSNWGQVAYFSVKGEGDGIYIDLK